MAASRGEMSMRRTVYFALDAVWSFAVSTLIWWFTLSNLHFDFYGNSDDTLGGVILVTGSVLYLILTVVYIVIGFKKVRAWQWWMSVIAVLISLGMGFAGIFGATYGVELINGYFLCEGIPVVA